MQSSRPRTPLIGRIAVPGDKSISHRALMFAALAVGRTTITGLLEGHDVLATAAAMRALGAGIEKTNEGMWHVDGVGIGGLSEPSNVLDMGNSGTAARLLAGILATHDFVSFMTGDASLRGRPMRRVIEPLQKFGARFVAREGGRLPMAITGARDPMPVDHVSQIASAQVKSAVLLAGLNTPGFTTVTEPLPSRDHSENMLRHFGADIRVEIVGEGRRVTLAGQPELLARDIVVPGDPSSAAFPLVAALLVPGSHVTVCGVGMNPLRIGLLTCLRDMGASLDIVPAADIAGEPAADVTVVFSDLRAIDVPASRAPSMIDEYPVLAIAAACACGTTRMRGLAELRVKESDRLAATAAMLRVNGVEVDIEGDDLLVHGTGRPPPGGGMVATHMDHRLAMSTLVLGCATDRPVGVDETAFIDTSFPGFAALMASLGAEFS